MAKSNPFFRVDSGDDPKLKEPELENQPLLKERDKPSSFFLAVLFTSLKMLILAFIVVCFIGFGLGGGRRIRFQHIPEDFRWHAGN